MTTPTTAQTPAQTPARLEVQGLVRDFGGRRVVDDVSFAIPAGQVTCLLGQSGCGKSTTLRMIAGVDMQDRGKIFVDGNLAIAQCERDMSGYRNRLRIQPQLGGHLSIERGQAVTQLQFARHDPQRIGRHAGIVGIEAVQFRQHLLAQEVSHRRQ